MWSVEANIRSWKLSLAVVLASASIWCGPDETQAQFTLKFPINIERIQTNPAKSNLATKELTVFQAVRLPHELDQPTKSLKLYFRFALNTKPDLRDASERVSATLTDKSGKVLAQVVGDASPGNRASVAEDEIEVTMLLQRDPDQPDLIDEVWHELAAEKSTLKLTLGVPTTIEIKAPKAVQFNSKSLVQKTGATDFDQKHLHQLIVAKLAKDTNLPKPIHAQVASKTMDVWAKRNLLKKVVSDAHDSDVDPETQKYSWGTIPANREIAMQVGIQFGVAGRVEVTDSIEISIETLKLKARSAVKPRTFIPDPHAGAGRDQ